MKNGYELWDGFLRVDQLSNLKRLAKRQKRTVASVVREALDRYIRISLK